MSCLRAAVLISLLGCSQAPSEPIGMEPPPGPPGTTSEIARSGSRLSARFVEAEGGARRFVDFWDHQVEQGCIFRALERDAEAVFCTPKASAEQLYLDASCERPGLRTNYDQHSLLFPIPTYHSAPIPLLGAVALGEKQPADSPFYYQSGGECFEIGRSDSLYAIAETMEVTQFVSATLDQVEVAPGITQLRLTSEDGSVLNTNLTDTRTLLNCEPERTSAGIRCATEPEPLEDTGLTDDNCERLMYFDYGAPRLAKVSGSPHGRDGTYILEAAEGQFSAPERTANRLSADQVCEPASLNNSRMTLYQGTLYNEERWPELTIEEVGEGHLKTTFATTLDGKRLTYANLAAGIVFEDRRAQDVCSVGYLQGQLQCIQHVSASAFLEEVFTDTRCSTKQEVVIVRPDLVQDVLPVREGWSSAEQGGLPQYRTAQLGAPLDSPHILTQEGTCVQMSNLFNAHRVEMLDPEVSPNPLRLLISAPEK